jgi:hypothetical protein
LQGIDFVTLGMPWIIQELDLCFSEEEVWGVIKQMELDKAPGPDGFTGRFYQYTWPVIKRDILQVFAALWSLDARSLFLLNQAYMVILCKKPDAEEIKDFHSISLIHSFGNLFTTVLSGRLAPHVANLVLLNQSVFIRGRAIQDNFHTVQSSAKLLHVCKTPCIPLSWTSPRLSIR